MASDSQRRARAAKFFMNRSRSVIPSALNSSDTHITSFSRRQRCKLAISSSVRPVMPASLMYAS